MKALAALSLVALFASPAWAQTRQPAQMTTLPTTTPQEFDLLDKTGAWVPIGTAINLNSVRNFGADPTGAVDSTAAFNAALIAQGVNGGCVYVPVGNYLVTDALTAAASNSCIRGDGRTQSVIWAYSGIAGKPNFNLSALGVLVLPNNHGGSGATVRDVGFEFNQPQTSTRANIVPFPPAIYAQNQARFKIQDVRVSDANYCLDARGQAGGSFIVNFECGSLTTGMQWDGSSDSVHWTDFHFWNFGVQIGAPNPLSNVFIDQSNNCFINGRIDDLFAKGTSCFAGNAVFTANATTGGLPQMFDGIGIDTNAQTTVAGGDIRMVNGYSTGGSTGIYPLINVSGGTLSLQKWKVGTNSAFPPVQVSGGSLSLDFSTLNCNNPAFSCASVSGGNLSILNSLMGLPSGAWTAPYVAQTGGFLRFMGNYFNVGATGGATGVSFAADSAGNQFANNAMNGWGFVLPATHTLGQYGFIATSDGRMTANKPVSADSLTMTQASPTLVFKASGAQPTDQKNWDFFEDNTGNLAIRLANDAYNSSNNLVTYTRGTGFSLTGAKMTVAAPLSATSFQTAGVAGFSGTKTAGTCVLTISGGIITNVTGC